MHKLSGVYGGRFSGAGFKGAIIALVDPAYKESIEAMDKVIYQKIELFNDDDKMKYYKL